MQMKKMLQKMTGKIKTFDFNSLAILITFALTINSFVYKNFFFLGFFLFFSFISSLATKYGLKVIAKLKFFQNIRDVGPTRHFFKVNTPTAGGIFIIIPFLILLILITIKLSSMKIFLLFFSTLGFFLIGLLDDYLSI